MYMRTGVEAPLARVAQGQPISSRTSATTPAHVPATRINETAPPAPTNLKRGALAGPAGSAGDEPDAKRHKTNNRGTSLCEGVAWGLVAPVRGKCPRDNTSARQCWICLDNRHGRAITTTRTMVLSRK